MLGNAKIAWKFFPPLAAYAVLRRFRKLKKNYEV